MNVRVQGGVVRVCRWKIEYYIGERHFEEYVVTEEEADYLVSKYGATKTMLDTSNDEWVDGITVPASSTTPKADAEAIIAKGKSAYLNSLTIPTAETSAVEMMRRILKDSPVENGDDKIWVSGLYEDWTPGNFLVGDIRNANGQTWECSQNHNNSEFPDINPDNIQTWANFWHPLHGRTPETARPWVQPTYGTTDIYHTGEYMIFTDGYMYKCLSDTNFSPDEYAAAWEKVS